MPLAVPEPLASLVPRGTGNKEILKPKPFQETAIGAAKAIKRIMDEMDWKLERVAVDAPSAPAVTRRRLSEIELARDGLSSFSTPTRGMWSEIREKCSKHLRNGGTPSTLPYGNKIWMLYGFELFTALRRVLTADIIEVYPFAIVRALLPACEHKSTEKGYQNQLAAIGAQTGWASRPLEDKLKATVAGSRHDRLDAFMAAWVASLPPRRRRAFGDPRRKDDAIYVPLISNVDKRFRL